MIGGAVFLSAIFLFISALKKFEASGVLPVVGGLTPIFTLFAAVLFLGRHIGIGDALGFAVLICGSFIFLAIEEKTFRLQAFFLASFAALLFAVSDILKKTAFNHGHFLTVFIWISFGGTILALSLLLVPSLRRRIFASFSLSEERTKKIYLLNRALATLGTVVLHYAFFLGHPAMVEGAQSFKYVVIFFAAWILLKEKFYGKILFWKAAGTLLIVFGVVWLGLVEYLRAMPLPDMRWGITFSEKFAKELEGDNLPAQAGWRQTYLDILDDLGAKHLRLIAYWDIVEPEQGKFDFGDLDWQMEEAKKRGADVVLAFGRKAPRWPECHIPGWARELPESGAQFQDNLMNYIKTTVEHYSNNNAVIAWQIENEPLFPFGDCKPLGVKVLNKEISLVRSLDTRPIALTDSGEIGFAWPYLSAKSDIFGTTLYRYVHNRILGDIEYTLIPPGYFRLKVLWANKILGKDVFVAELQGEPWQSKPLSNTTMEEQYNTMNPQRFLAVTEYAKNSGFPLSYWWGVEWWHWMKVKNNNPEMWNLAKKLFNK